jgi:hypothetical protein
VLVQRFVTRSSAPRALRRRRPAKRDAKPRSETGARLFAVEYDISGARPDSFQQALRDDWMYLVDELKITCHPRLPAPRG